MMKIGITGGTGFVGQHLSELLTSKGHEVVIFTTQVAKKPVKPRLAYAHWNPRNGACDLNSLKSVNAVVHLAGAGIADKRWTAKRKKEILESRVNGTNFLVAQLKAHAPGCKTLISASAIGYYGPDRGGSVPFDETVAASNDFLGDTCRQWEASSQTASAIVRTAILRFGIVLGRDGGAYPSFVTPLSMGVMPILGPGKQVMSWIAIDDLTRFILFVLEHGHISGIYNAVAPQPVSHETLIRTMAVERSGIKIPVKVPSFLLKMVLGELSEELLKSCTVSANKTIGTGFTFRYPDIVSAIRHLSIQK